MKSTKCLVCFPLFLELAIHWNSKQDLERIELRHLFPLALRALQRTNLSFGISNSPSLEWFSENLFFMGRYQWLLQDSDCTVSLVLKFPWHPSVAKTVMIKDDSTNRQYETESTNSPKIPSTPQIEAVVFQFSCVALFYRLTTWQSCCFYPLDACAYVVLVELDSGAETWTQNSKSHNQICQNCLEEGHTVRSWAIISEV